ncbi:hypothetical protein Bcav_1151 [Beutenbergia cavernae DSM 12333]|uniref:Uncharacterized protein n=1 Tax=Beutenbergia cavernae (strain ATCC BAA-8 / DSM 12333 / CCUG 43141 / JCM 11478 / NBRC 16432 / NCIMB 13614 / HKI 0122) TaxID=471853 RepID=C5C107_BEUC1|nr:acyl-CoA carboxylase epsilon subunit [Beutenbergia cavernae]ACQ79411.1 hypothetical protein Bcav_1151 [Beutenbergia cavernae DSM 12333]
MRLFGRRPAPDEAPADAEVAVTLDAAGQPVVHVVRGAPDDVELAALVAGLAAARAALAAEADDDAAPSSAWVAASRVRRLPGTGAGAAPAFGSAGRGLDAWRRSLRA